jgi:hypothetical protein
LNRRGTKDGRPANVHASSEANAWEKPIEVLDKFVRFATWIAAVLRGTRARLHKVEVANATRCNLASFSAEEFQDTGIDPSDAAGIASWQPDLPFFMQTGFGRK